MFRFALAAAAAAIATGALADVQPNLAYSDAIVSSEAMERTDKYTIVGETDLMALSPMNDDGSVKAIVEIPAGTSAKWEVSKDNTKSVYWEFKNDAPRVVNYLGYPGNYGTIPGTALPKELGGDGDPLDVLVLGQAAPRGEVIDIRVIGVLKMLDGGEQDDKLIAVMTKASPFAGIESMAQLRAEFAGVAEIVELWFANYKGPDGGMEALGYADVDEAMKVLETSVAQYGE